MNSNELMKHISVYLNTIMEFLRKESNVNNGEQFSVFFLFYLHPAYVSPFMLRLFQIMCFCCGKLTA